MSKCIERWFENYAVCQALANPRGSVELTEFVQSIVHTESSGLLREHNDVIQMQDERIAVLRAEVDRLERERVERVQVHATEIKQLAAEQCTEVKEIYQKHWVEIRELHEQHSAEIKKVRSELDG